MEEYGHFFENDRLKDIGLTVRAYNYCLSHGIQTIRDLLDYYAANNDSIPSGKNAGHYTIAELTRLCQSLLREVADVRGKKEKYGTIQDWDLSVRAYNVLQSYRLVTKKALLSFYHEHNQTIPNDLRNCGRKTIKEITQLCQFLMKVDWASPENPHADAESTKVEEDPVIKKQVAQKATFQVLGLFSKIVSLRTEDVDFLSSYMERNGHYPLMWLLSKYIDSDGDLACFALSYGIDYKKGRKTISEIAKEMNVTQSRVGQRVNKGYNKLFGGHSDFSKCLQRADKQYLLNCFGQKDYLSSSDKIPQIADVNNSEGTSFTNAFVLSYFSVIFGQYKCFGNLEKSNRNHVIRLISKDLCKAINFERLFSDFDTMVEDASNEVNLNLREFIEDSSSWTHFSMNLVDRVLRIIKTYALSEYGLYEEEVADVIHILPKKYDIAGIVYGIVSEARSPLTVSEIISVASKQYPLCTFSEDVVRIALKEDTRIQFIRSGNQQTRFLLASSNVPTSIRDAVVRLLSDSPVPVSLDDIVVYVLAYFPTSSRSSIRTSILSDSQNRFVLYEGSLFGLASKEYPECFVRVNDAARIPLADRLIILKQFLDTERRFPSQDSTDEKEVELARWVERNQDKPEVRDLIETYAPDIWKENCRRCEEYIVSHKGKLPPKDSEPRLYRWLLNASDDMRNELFSQEQRRMFLHLTMQIRR